MASGKMSRDKGQRGEREVIELLRPVVSEAYAKAGLPEPQLKRNLMQSREGGHDIVGLEWLALEVKRQETLNVNAWWKQAVQQAERAGGMVPVLLYRQNTKLWKVQLHLMIPSGRTLVKCVGTVELNAFLVWLGVELGRRLADNIAGKGVQTHGDGATGGEGRG